MKLRYKKTGDEFSGYRWNVHAMAEVLTGDDTVSIRDLDVLIGGQWKDLGQAFRDRDVISDNYNEFFGEPKTEEDRKRGYFL